MNHEMTLATLNAAGLCQFQKLQSDAVAVVTNRFYTTHAASYERFGIRGREACSEDLAFHLEFLRPVLEFGLLQPMVDYLQWLNGVLTARQIPTQHLAQSLDWLAEYFSEHMDAEYGAIVVAALHSASISFQTDGLIPLLPKIPLEPWPELADFEAALLSGKRNEAYAVLHRCIAQGKSLTEIELRIIQPALYAIGEKWQANQVSVAQEHMATAIVQSVMTLALQHFEPAAPINKRILLACVEGNNHAVGLQMVADSFLLAGWDVQYLGANVPVQSLIQQTVEYHPDLIGLSVSFPQQVRIARSVISQLKSKFGDKCPAVMVGGLAFNRFNGLVGVVDADSFAADAQSAVQRAHSVMENSCR